MMNLTNYAKIKTLSEKELFQMLNNEEKTLEKAVLLHGCICHKEIYIQFNWDYMVDIHSLQITSLNSKDLLAFYSMKIEFSYDGKRFMNSIIRDDFVWEENRIETKEVFLESFEKQLFSHVKAIRLMWTDAQEQAGMFPLVNIKVIGERKMNDLRIKLLNADDLPVENAEVIKSKGDKVVTDIAGTCVVAKEDYPLVVKAEGYYDMYLKDEKDTYTLKTYKKWEDQVVNDETLDGKVKYTENWAYYNAYPGDRFYKDVAKNRLLYNTDAHGTKLANETATLEFAGKNIKVFGLADSYGGKAVLSIDGKEEEINFFRERLEDGKNNSQSYNLLYENYDLTDCTHELKITTLEKEDREDDNVCIAVLDFFDFSDIPVFNRFSFEPYTVTEVGSDWAMATQKLMSKGKYKIDEVGFVSSDINVPSVSDIKTVAKLNEDGTITETIKGLKPFTKYQCRAYAIVDGVVYYGHENFRFRTLGETVLDHEMYGGFPSEEFVLSAIKTKSNIIWSVENETILVDGEILPSENVVSIKASANVAKVILNKEGQADVVATDEDGNKTFCSVTVARKEKKDLAKTPPMGWNSWNIFIRKINKFNIGETIDAMLKPITKDGKSLKDCGYNYVIIDGGWRENYLAQDGSLIPSTLMGDEAGLCELAKKCKDNGLHVGLHVCPGDRDCLGQPMGSKWVEQAHYKNYKDWGIEFLKIDECQHGQYEYSDKIDYSRWLYVREKYFMDNCGADIVYSISNYHFDNWQHEVANTWRTSGDIATQANTTEIIGARWNYYGKGEYFSVYDCANHSNNSADFAKAGTWNDAEMCVVGDIGLNEYESKSHFNLWCLMASPLMLGNDLRDMSDEVIETITNQELIDINQNSLALQGKRIVKKTLDGEDVNSIEKALEVWVKPLANGEMAILLLNNTDDSEQDVSINWSDVVYDNAVQNIKVTLEKEVYSVRDVNKHEDLGEFAKGFTAKQLKPHQSVMIIVK